MQAGSTPPITRTPEAGGEAPTLHGPILYVLAAGTILALGLNWPIMGVGVRLVPPMWLAAFRLCGAALAIGLLLAATGRFRPPSRHDYPVIASVGLVRVGAVMILVFKALQLVPPGRSSILVYTNSLWAVPMAVWALGERFTSRRLLAVTVGCIGIVVLTTPWQVSWSSGGALLGYGLLILAAVAAAAGTVHVRWHRWNGSALELMPWQLGIAGVGALIFALLVEGPPAVTWTAQTTAVVAYQCLIASAFGLWGTLQVSRSLPAISATILMMAIPAVGLGSSVIFLDEPFTADVFAGLVLILAGVGISLSSNREAGAGLGTSP